LTSSSIRDDHDLCKPSIQDRVHFYTGLFIDGETVESLEGREGFPVFGFVPSFFPKEESTGVA
jgi:hypothetical protein